MLAVVQFKIYRLSLKDKNLKIKIYNTIITTFLDALKNCERHLLVSPCLSVLLSLWTVYPHGINRLPLGGFSLNLIFQYSSKTCQENLSFINIWQE